MNERAWLTSNDPAAMLRHLERTPGFAEDEGTPAKASDRKLRLFACACCRQVWDRLTDERCRKCIEAAEQYADDPSAAITPFYADAADRFEEMDDSGEAELWQAVVARHCCNTRRDDFPGRVGGSILQALLRQRRESATGAVLAALLRDMVAPFRPLASPWPASPSWAESLARRHAEQVALGAYEVRPARWVCTRHGVVPESEVYEAEGGGHGHAHKTEDCWQEASLVSDGALDPERLAVLADACEEAGCTDEALLRSLRGQVYKPHDRCHYCDGSGIDREKLNQPNVRYMVPPRCMHCRGGEVANTGGWVPASVPRYRGFWAVDLLTGRA